MIQSIVFSDDLIACLSCDVFYRCIELQGTMSRAQACLVSLEEAHSTSRELHEKDLTCL
jgi:hypothetical protein